MLMPLPNHGTQRLPNDDGNGIQCDILEQEQNRLIKMLKYAFTRVVMLATSNIVFKSSNRGLRYIQHFTTAKHVRFVLRV